MFICSFKLNKTGVLSAIAALCLSLTLVFLMLPESTDSTSALKGTTVQSEEAMVEYLSSIGRTVAPNALLIEEITIPATFDEKYTKYNELQKSCGFDLEQHQGKKAKKYTFKVLNYEDESIEVVANLLICDDVVIGGDVSSTLLNGFSEGLIPANKTEEVEKTE